MYSGFGQDPVSTLPPIQGHLECLAQGKWWMNGACMDAVDFATQVCATQLGGTFNPGTGECQMVIQPGMSEAAHKAACEATGGRWDAGKKTCAMATGPTEPPGPAPVQPPPAKAVPAGVPWGTLGIIGLGLTVLYMGARARGG